MNLQILYRDIYFILAVFMMAYLIVNLLKRRRRRKDLKYNKNFQYDIRSAGYAMDSISSSLGLKKDFSKGKELLESVMKEMGISKENYDKNTTKKILKYMLKQSKENPVNLNKRSAKPVLKYMHCNFQLCLETGAYHQKVQAQLKRKMRNVSNKDIEKYLQKCGVDYTGSTVKSIKRSFAHYEIQQDMHRQMEADMQNQMMNDMQSQMMTDMQNQMMFDMQNQMMMDMQNQMMLDMQNQMQMQMQNELQNQMQNQMQTDMMNSMHESQMAITSYDHGGHMNNFDSMHNDFNNHLGM